jgi:hypothetical protein
MYADYNKVINYSINLILNRENQMKLHGRIWFNLEFIQIEEEKGDKITRICLSLITTLAKYRSTSKELDSDLRLLQLSKEKK